MAETQNDPLLPGYSFNAHLVAGLTPIDAEGHLDFFIDRPLGMKGYILNLTIRGEGIVKNNGKEFICKPGDMLLTAGRNSSLWAQSAGQTVVSPVGILPPARLLAGVAQLAVDLRPDRLLPPRRGRASGLFHAASANYRCFPARGALLGAAGDQPAGAAFFTARRGDQRVDESAAR